MPLKKATQAVIAPNICTTDTTQTITGIKTFSNAINANILGNAATATIANAVSSIPSGTLITSPVFAGTATGSLISKIIQGVTDGSSASYGYIGEQISISSALSTIASNTITTGASLTLTPGSWDVFGNATFNFTGVSAVAGDIIGASISLTNNTLVTNQQQVLMLPAITTQSQTPAFAFVTPRVRFDVSTNTIVYLVVQSPATTAGTMQFSSIIKANRVR